MIPLKDDNPRKGFPVITIALITANIIVFYFSYLQPGFDRIIMTYGAIPAEILEGRQLQTLLTSMFLHGGFMHIGSNMLYLWIFGDNIETLLGSVRFIFFYLICGLLAALAHVYSGGVSTVPMVGASGAISGVLGAYLIKYPKARVLVLIPIIWFLTIRKIPALFVLGLWFVMQLFSGLATVQTEGGGVAFWAHIGGFVAGVLLILPFAPKRRTSSSYF